MIILSSINIIILISLLFYDKTKYKNLFSPGSLFLYFALVPAFSNLYFSINEVAFVDLILSLVVAKYQDITLVNIALLLQIFLNLVTYASIQIGIRSRPRIILQIVNRLSNFKRLSNQCLKSNDHLKNSNIFGYAIYIIGLFFYFIYLEKSGGLFVLWSNVAMRAELGAGLGYYHSISHFCLMIGGSLIFYSSILKQNYYFSIAIIILTFILYATLGARGPSISFVIALFIIYHYKCRKIISFINIKTMIVGLILSVFTLSMLQFRQDSNLTNNLNAKEILFSAFESVESGLLARIGHLERDVVILGYFTEHDYWYGASYLGILSAPIPRTMYPNKPPVDSGMYLRSMALGRTINPPQPVIELDGSGWPENNMSGYMNFGLLGPFFLCIISGILYGKIFKSLQLLKFPIIGIIYFSSFFAQGPLSLSPKGLVDFFTFVALAILIRILYFGFLKNFLITPVGKAEG